MRGSETGLQVVSLAGSPASPRVAELFMQILEQVGEPALDSSADGNEETVVLELSINGFKYTLSRSIPLLTQTQVNLSPREKEIIRLVGRGLANKAIASVLEVSQWTVATHLRRVFTKLGVCSRAEMIARVMEEGLLEGMHLADLA